MFELPPYRKCPRCKNDTFGTLSVGGTRHAKRCKDCRYSHDEVLPDVNKRVVYLDQFAVSELYKTKEGKRRPGAPNELFWKDCYALANRAYLRQQVIFPASNLHSDETIVWHSPEDLMLAHEMFSGETSFLPTDEIAMMQEWDFAEAFIKGLSAPAINFDVDGVLKGTRNVWLPVFHISVKSDYSMFAPGLRLDRASAEASLRQLAKGWADNRRTFDQILKHELSSYGSAMRLALRGQVEKTNAAIASNDPSAILDLQFGLINRFSRLARMFERNGIAEHDAFREVSKFLDWPENQNQPTHKIFAYLIAALGWRISSGQSPEVSAGILNDFTAIATYAPYVDAMFVDKQCASLLAQGRLRSEISYRARIFSMNDKEEFMQYLRQLCDAASDEVRAFAHDLYGAQP